MYKLLISLTIKYYKMKDSVIDLHLSSAHYAERRGYRLNHCRMVAWLIDNFRLIQKGEVTYEDYVRYGDARGIATFIEEAFDTYKNQELAY